MGEVAPQEVNVTLAAVVRLRAFIACALQRGEAMGDVGAGQISLEIGETGI